MNIPSFYLEPAHYEVDVEVLRFLRNRVFVEEQGISPELEFDELDPHCHHVVARDDQGKPIGTGRLSPQGQIGRMAVLKEWRHQGVGKSILRTLIEKARSLGWAKVTVNAQVTACGFYQAFGFSLEGEPFIKAGIPHQAMQLMLQPLEKPDRSDPSPRLASVEAKRLDGVEFVLAATQQLILQSRRQLCIYSRDLDYAIFGQKQIVEALKQFALNNRNSMVQMIIQEPENLQRQSHPVLALAQRLTSYFLIRAPLEVEDIQYPSTFVISDTQGYLFRQLGNRYQGHWSPNLPARNRQLREEFDNVWQRSRLCTEFRALGL
jgi:predicted GNAT family N-acyltransferase